LDRNYDPEREGARPNVFDEEELSWPEKPILKCLYADKLGLAEDYLEELEASDDGGGYGSTHVLIGCIILKVYSTIPHELIDPIIEKTIASIVREQQRSRIGDIYSERVECLEWLGYEHYVKEAWVFRIIAGQMSNGGWYWNRSLFRPETDQHPTCVALTSLIQYREKQIKKNLHHQGPRPTDIGRVYRCSTTDMSEHENR
jgi:hypothetical protein